MANEERVREEIAAPPTEDYIREKAAAGWRLVAVEWARPSTADCGDAGEIKEEIPYGLQVAGDCRHLEENPTEKAAMMTMLAMIVEDRPLSQVAAGLNAEGFHTRDGRDWTQTAIFYMMPRLIQTAPQIFSSGEWRDRRAQVTARLAQLIG
jgi:hypothetical protein